METNVILADYASRTDKAKKGCNNVILKIKSELKTREKAELGLTVARQGDSLTQHNGYTFSTKDRDNNDNNRNCTVEYTGAWWYYNCYDSNLNGQWTSGNIRGSTWTTFTRSKSVDLSEMKIRRLD